MDYTSYLFAALIIVAVTIILAVKYGKGIANWIRIIGIGAVCANIALLLPLPLLSEKNLTLSILSALQAGYFNAPYVEFFEKLYTYGEPDKFLFKIYKNILYFLLVLSPLFLGGIIFSFFDSTMMMIKYNFYVLFYDIYYFSELNDRSMLLASSIKNKKRYLVVFCNVFEGSRLYSEALKQGHVFFTMNEHSLRRYGRKQCQFFEISDNKTEALSGTQQLITRFSKDANKERFKIFLFTDQDEAEILMDATDKHGLPVSIINEPVTTAYNLLFEHPLYRAPKAAQESKFSILITGAGTIGLEIIKAAVWCGQMDGFSLEINVVDKDAALIESKFKLDCPELMNGEYNIKFLNADIQTEHFEKLLDEHCQMTNYIVICAGSDELNIKTALYLRKYYLRKNKGIPYEPLIYTQVSNEAKKKILSELTAISRDRIKKKKWEFNSDKSQNYKINTFGTYESVYSYNTVVNSAIDELAKNVNAVYEHTMESGISKEEILYNYRANEVNRRSSKANAVHIKYKLYMLGFEMSIENEDELASKKAMDELSVILNNNALLNNMAKMEHDRWMAFQRSEGYISASIEEAEDYKKYTGGHINRRAKMHACICSWEKLRLVSDKFDKNMVKYDIEMIKNIPQIIGAQENPEINISGVRYKLKKRSMPNANQPQKTE